MDKETFKTTEVHLDKIAEIVDDAFDSGRLLALQRELAELSTALGKRYSVSANITVDVFDQEQERTLPLLNTGVSAFAGQPPFRTWNDSTPQRYVVDGEIQVVPHDRCPKCWDSWDFKFENRSCPHCGTTLGENCKVLLDTDTCPNCEQGTVSMTKPTCDKCGFELDTSVVIWG